MPFFGTELRQNGDVLESDGCSTAVLPQGRQLGTAPGSSRRLGTRPQEFLRQPSAERARLHDATNPREGRERLRPRQAATSQRCASFVDFHRDPCRICLRASVSMRASGDARQWVRNPRHTAILMKGLVPFYRCGNKTKCCDFCRKERKERKGFVRFVAHDIRLPKQ